MHRRWCGVTQCHSGLTDRQSWGGWRSQQVRLSAYVYVYIYIYIYMYIYIYIYTPTYVHVHICKTKTQKNKDMVSPDSSPSPTPPAANRLPLAQRLQQLAALAGLPLLHLPRAVGRWGALSRGERRQLELRIAKSETQHHPSDTRIQFPCKYQQTMASTMRSKWGSLHFVRLSISNTCTPKGKNNSALVLFV